MFDLTRFWVCLSEGYFRPLLPLREKTGRSSYVHRKRENKKRRKNTNHCLWMMLGWCISVLGLHNEELLFRCADGVSHSRFLRLLHFTKMLLTN